MWRRCRLNNSSVCLYCVHLVNVVAQLLTYITFRHTFKSVKPDLNLQSSEHCTPPATIQSHTSLPEPSVIGPFQSSRATWTERKRRLCMFLGKWTEASAPGCRLVIASKLTIWRLKNTFNVLQIFHRRLVFLCFRLLCFNSASPSVVTISTA